jgi:hypothetical protein
MKELLGNSVNRRLFLKSLGMGTVLWPFRRERVLWAARPVVVQPRLRLPRAYLLVQDVSTYNQSKFGAFSTTEEARSLFGQIAGRVDAVEFGSLFYDDHDLRAHEAVAREAALQGVDLWVSTFRMLRRVRAFGAIRPEFQAQVMQADGRIVPARTLEEAGYPSETLFDVLNPEAMDWFAGAFRHKYLERMKGLLTGLFFNEDCLTYIAKQPPNTVRYDYWRNPTFSPRVLALWRAYCRQREVTQDGELVDKFPVHDPKMVANGAGRSQFVPGWNVPAEIEPGQRFVDLPRAEGVWRHWYDFTCDLFLKNWIGRIAAAANEVNRGEPGWKGTMYFGLHHWSLPYEEVQDPNFAVPRIHEWCAWGRQRGVDLAKLAGHPDIDAIICETFPPIAANLELFMAEFARITRAAGKTLGVMLHRDDEWPLKLDEEPRRWALIEKYRPTIITRVPLQHMLPGNEFYTAEGEALFARGLARYKKGPD